MGSPTILMQSGVGPRDILQAAGVQVALHLPGVGQHLQDHVVRRILLSSRESTHASDSVLECSACLQHNC